MRFVYFSNFVYSPHRGQDHQIAQIILRPTGDGFSKPMGPTKQRWCITKLFGSFSRLVMVYCEADQDNFNDQPVMISRNR
ncbi:hypothetical protein JCGZ_03203 [Jatropha curcas]|uniref:Uncharacterized protein n=1 Tax=Jatropha curcas TaxID=180498 RepID=A0A067JGN8_JATCU|nr:hypothetical protein JCGZ_03203 [Jatropha curcas]